MELYEMGCFCIFPQIVFQINRMYSKILQPGQLHLIQPSQWVRAYDKQGQVISLTQHYKMKTQLTLLKLCFWVGSQPVQIFKYFIFPFWYNSLLSAESYKEESWTLLIPTSSWCARTHLKISRRINKTADIVFFSSHTDFQKLYSLHCLSLYYIYQQGFLMAHVVNNLL